MNCWGVFNAACLETVNGVLAATFLTEACGLELNNFIPCVNKRKANAVLVNSNLYMRRSLPIRQFNQRTIQIFFGSKTTCKLFTGRGVQGSKIMPFFNIWVLKCRILHLFASVN